MPVQPVTILAEAVGLRVEDAIYAWVIVAAVMVTVWPAVILTLSRMISEADVPTVRPVIMSVLLLSLILAAAAVPVLSAEVSECGMVRVRTAPVAVPQGSVNGMVARTEAIAVVPISMYPAAEPASMAVATAVMRACFTAVVYVTAMV